MKGGVGRYTKNLVQAIAKKPSVDVSVAISASAASEPTSDPSQDRQAAIMLVSIEVP